MVMNKRHRFLLTGFISLASALGPLAQEAPDLSKPTAFESTSVLQLYPSATTEEVDWNSTFALLRDQNVLKKAAKLISTDVTTLEELTSFLADPEKRQLHIIARHKDRDTAKKIATIFSTTFLEASKAAEIERAQALLDKLDLQLEEQNAKVLKRRKELEKLLEEYDLSTSKPSAPGQTLEQDRMTYQKAREALKEASQKKKEEAKKDDIIYRKDK